VRIFELFFSQLNFEKAQKGHRNDCEKKETPWV
jgi:hypothetical protein